MKSKMMIVLMLMAGSLWTLIMLQPSPVLAQSPQGGPDLASINAELKQIAHSYQQAADAGARARMENRAHELLSQLFDAKVQSEQHRIQEAEQRVMEQRQRINELEARAAEKNVRQRERRDHRRSHVRTDNRGLEAQKQKLNAEENRINAEKQKVADMQRHKPDLVHSAVQRVLDTGELPEWAAKD